MFNNVTYSLVARAEVECGMLLKTVKDQWLPVFIYQTLFVRPGPAVKKNEYLLK